MQPRVRTETLATSDVFLSYASEDRAKATDLARVLAARGWSVWWDRYIPPGKEYDDVIQEAVNGAKCVVVLWSRHSVESRWVRDEAEEGANRKILVPASIEDATIPLGFRHIQAARLNDWDGAATHPGVGQLVERVSQILARPAVPVPPEPDVRPRRLPLLWTVVPTVVAALLAGGLMFWRIPTRVEADLTVSRARLTIGPARSQVLSIVGPAAVASLTFEKFAAIAFEAETLEIADPDAGEAVPDAAWRRIPRNDRKVTLVAGEAQLNPAVTFESTPRSAAVGRLDAVTVTQGSVVTLESRGGGTPRLTVRIDGPKPGAIVAMPAPVRIFADHASLDDGSAPLATNGSVMYRARLSAESPLVEVTGNPEALVFSFTVPSAGADSPSLFSDEGIPVTALDFTELNELGDRVSAVRADGNIGYPDHPDIPRVPVRPGDFVGLEGLTGFQVRDVKTGASPGSLQVHLAGVARRVTTRSGDHTVDHRLTGFDALWHSSRLAVLFAVVVWVFSTTLSALRQYNEWRKQ